MINLVKTHTAKQRVNRAAAVTVNPSNRFNLEKGNGKGLHRINLKKD